MQVTQIIVGRVNILQFVSRGRSGISTTELDKVKYIKMV